MCAFSMTFQQMSEKNLSAMESCYKLYTWVNYTIFMLLLQIFWKIRQISDYFNEQPSEDIRPMTNVMEFTPFTKASKMRRHIRSMSDVQNSTPYYLASRSHRKYSYHTLMYDSDTRTKRIKTHVRRRYLESSDSSDYSETTKTKHSTIERKIVKPTDSMRFL